MGENLEVVWAEFSTISQAVLLDNAKNALSMQMTKSKVENSAQVSSYQLKFVHDYCLGKTTSKAKGRLLKTCWFCSDIFYFFRLKKDLCSSEHIFVVTQPLHFFICERCLYFSLLRKTFAQTKFVFELINFSFVLIFFNLHFYIIPTDALVTIFKGSFTLTISNCDFTLRFHSL